MNPPNYRLGTAEEHCGNCGAFNKPQSYCQMFGVHVEIPMTCDDWYRGQGGRRLKIHKPKEG